ncbi:MAG: hypothetical protein SPH48_07220 [Sodaliphilus sp.]|nr:hypothetical protein [Sodaliphilus sp.]
MLPNCEWNQKQKHKKQPFGDATALPSEGGVGDVVWLIQAPALNQTCHSTNDRCEALASLKGCFLCFCFSPPVFFH